MEATADAIQETERKRCSRKESANFIR